MMRRVRGTRDVVDKPWLAESDLFELLEYWMASSAIAVSRFQPGLSRKG
jgi:hypothetical protein